MNLVLKKLASLNEELQKYRSFNQQTDVGEAVSIDHNDDCPENVVPTSNKDVNTLNFPNLSRVIGENVIADVIDELIGDAYFITYVSYT